MVQLATKGPPRRVPSWRRCWASWEALTGRKRPPGRTTMEKNTSFYKGFYRDFTIKKLYNYKTYNIYIICVLIYIYIYDMIEIWWLLMCLCGYLPLFCSPSIDDHSLWDPRPSVAILSGCYAPGLRLVAIPSTWEPSDVSTPCEKPMFSGK